MASVSNWVRLHFFNRRPLVDLYNLKALSERKDFSGSETLVGIQKCFVYKPDIGNYIAKFIKPTEVLDMAQYIKIIFYQFELKENYESVVEFLSSRTYQKSTFLEIKSLFSILNQMRTSGLHTGSKKELAEAAQILDLLMCRICIINPTIQYPISWIKSHGLKGLMPMVLKQQSEALSNKILNNEKEKILQHFDNGCGICFDSFETGDEYSILDCCDHLFCLSCTHKWFVFVDKTLMTCPSCRNEVKSWTTNRCWEQQRHNILSEQKNAIVTDGCFLDKHFTRGHIEIDLAGASFHELVAETKTHLLEIESLIMYGDERASIDRSNGSFLEETTMLHDESATELLQEEMSNLHLEDSNDNINYNEYADEYANSDFPLNNPNDTLDQEADISFEGSIPEDEESIVEVADVDISQETSRAIVFQLLSLSAMLCNRSLVYPDEDNQLKIGSALSIATGICGSVGIDLFLLLTLEEVTLLLERLRFLQLRRKTNYSLSPFIKFMEDLCNI